MKELLFILKTPNHNIRNAIAIPKIFKQSQTVEIIVMASPAYVEAWCSWRYPTLITVCFLLSLLSVQRNVGEDARNREDFAFVASLRKLVDEHLCGATILTYYVTLTAAHCVVKDDGDVIDKHLLFLIAGSPFNICTNCLKTLQLVEDIEVHPDYLRHGFTNDFALLYGRYKYEFTENLHAVKMPYDELDPDFFESGRPCIGLAWRYTEAFEEDVESPPSHFKSYSMTEVTKLELKLSTSCNTAFLKLCPLTEWENVCAMGPQGSVCQGDSGSPLLCDGILVGITSFGLGCKQAPGVFSRVDTQLSWLKAASLGKRTIASATNTQLAVSVAVLLWSKRH